MSTESLYYRKSKVTRVFAPNHAAYKLSLANELPFPAALVIPDHGKTC